jgi:Zn-dependent peptidase ImmA (M78 family)
LESSTAKGTRLENQVFELVSKLLKDDNFIVPKKISKVFKKKGYYSLKREKDIIFDVTIETTLPNANNYSILTIIECKNLNKKVGVEDIEEFGSKIKQVGEHNTKGIIITTHSFQDTVLTIAKKEGIALVRLNTTNEIQWINYRKDSNRINLFENELELTDETYLNEPFVCKISDKKITNFADLLLDFSLIDYFNDSEEFIEIPFVTHDRFNYIVNKLYKNNIYDKTVLNFDKLTKFLEPKYNVKFEYDLLEDENYLGKIEFNPLTIKISNKARTDRNRWRFTLAHEIGHLILHSPLLKERLEEKNDTENTLALKYSSTNKNSERLEIQANLFASYLLLPECMLLPVMNAMFTEYRIHRKCLILDSQPVNQKEVFQILSRLSILFEASIESIKIRLMKLNLLVDKTDYRIGTLIREYFK